MKFSNFMRICAFAFCFIMNSCASKEFWQYVVEKEPDKPSTTRENGTPVVNPGVAPQNVKVVYSDGNQSTEVVIPILTSGQQIIIDHSSTKQPNAIALGPIAPVPADKSAEDAYVSQGLPVVKSELSTSIVKTHEKIRELVKQGQYETALQYADLLLKRYPSHAKTLRTKGSLLLKIGETDAALEAYHKAQDIEFDRRVEDQIKAIETQEKSR